MVKRLWILNNIRMIFSNDHDHINVVQVSISSTNWKREVISCDFHVYSQQFGFVFLIFVFIAQLHFLIMLPSLFFSLLAWTHTKPACYVNSYFNALWTCWEFLNNCCCSILYDFICISEFFNAKMSCLIPPICNFCFACWKR